MILIQCLKCGRNYALTREQIVAGEYGPIFQFLAEHSAHFTVQTYTAVDLEKVRAAVKLLRESML